MNEIGEHINSAFDRDLEAVQAQIMKMGGLVEQAIRNALQALATQDADLSQKVRDDDRAIDNLQEMISEEVARVIALRGPIAGDLRILLCVFRVTNNLERIGDYAKNIAKRNALMIKMTQVEGGVQALRRMAQDVEQMLNKVLDAFIQRDVQMAYDVRDQDQEVDQVYDSLFREYLTHMMEDPRNISACIHLHFMAKNIERMGDHVTSIAEQVVYMVTGELPDEERAKGPRP